MPHIMSPSLAALLVTSLLLWSSGEGAQPLVPTCSAADAACEVTLEATYRYSMTHPESNLSGDVWVPVEARDDGLYTRGQPEDCSQPGYKLTDEEAEDVIIGDGSIRLVFAVNGSIPGPPIVVYEGQQVVVRFMNRLDNEAATLHFHGMHQRGTPYMDGAGGVSHCPISPGETFTYRFTAQPSGTFWYHAHLGSAFTMGLYGALVVLETDPISNRGLDPLPEINSEYVLAVQDWMQIPSSEVTSAATNVPTSFYNMVNSPDGECVETTLTADNAVCSPWPFYSAVINGKGYHHEFNTLDPVNPNVPLEVFPVELGQRYYFRVICAALTFPFKISVDQHQLHVTALDGRPIVTEVVDSIVISSGERVDFWILADDPDQTGSYWIRAETLEARLVDWEEMIPGHVDAILQYTNSTQLRPSSAPRECSSSSSCRILNCPYKVMADEYHSICVTLETLRSTVPDEKPWEDQDVMDIFLGLQIAPIKGYGLQSAFNGIKNKLPPYPLQIYGDLVDDLIYPCEWEDDLYGTECTHLIKVPLQKTVQIVIFGTLEESEPATNAHPIHIHGYSPAVATVRWPTYFDNGTIERFDQDIMCNSELCHDQIVWTDPAWANGNIPDLIGSQAPRKDTVLVPAGGYVVLRFKADNPGFWFMHCHIEYHGLEGMSLVLQVGEPQEIPSAPARMARCGDFELSEREYLEAVGPLESTSEAPSDDNMTTMATTTTSPGQDGDEDIQGWVISVGVLIVIIAILLVAIVILWCTGSASKSSYQPIPQT